MTGLRTLMRALAHRAGTTLVILLVALCASAAATVGPTYYVAAKGSILQDALTSTDAFGRGFESVQQGAVQNSADDLVSSADGVAGSVVHGQANLDRLFLPPVQALETPRYFIRSAESIQLVWRSAVCAHLHVSQGHCPVAPNQIMISTSLARLNGWRTGEAVQPAGTPPLTITGIYEAPRATEDYWFERGSVYFSYEIPAQQGSPYDAMFTPRATIEQLHGNPQGTVIVSRTLRVSQVRPSDVAGLGRLANRMTLAPPLSNVSTVSGIAPTVHTVRSSWTALAVPVVVITAELLALAWLLLFLVVTDAVEARGTEIALAKLRGYGAVRALVFGLAEPTTLLLVALPVGALVGWLGTRLLSTVLLRHGTPVGLPGLGWLGATVAVVGGVAAVVVAGRRTIRRPVVEEWRRANRRATDRSWVFDAVITTAALAGLVQLIAGGSLQSSKHSPLALLVPGLLGLAIAVVASRLLPIGCRALFARTRRGGTLGPFLAVRHIARRPGGTRTTMILATAVALSTFSIASWSTARDNRDRVAQVLVGAPTVLHVAAAPGVSLAGAVTAADPSGVHAAAVESYFSGDTQSMAVQPQRFGHVANWAAAGVAGAPGLLNGLHPPSPAPIVMVGDQVRLRLDVRRLTHGAALTMDLIAHGDSAPTPLEFGSVHGGEAVTRAAQLAGCPCVLRDLQLTPQSQVSGSVLLRGIDVHDATGWHPVPGTTVADHWEDQVDQRVFIAAGPAGLTWRFSAVLAQVAHARVGPATLRVHDRPVPLPAVVAAAVVPGENAMNANGLDGSSLPVAIDARAAEIPGAPRNGVVVDIVYAERSAYGNVQAADQQVWVRGPVVPIRRALARHGVATVGETSSSEVAHQLSRQGPALASVLFLADAGAAAILAGLAAILSLSAAARRRRYEYAALGAAGADRKALFTALALEQTAVVGFGALAGVVAGVASVVLAGHNVPEFVGRQLVTLHYRPSIGLLVSVLVAGVLALLGAALVAAAALLRTVSPEQLRESPT